MNKNKVTLTELLNDVEFAFKKLNELISVDDFCSCEAYPLQQFVELKLNLSTVRDTLNQLVFREINAGYSNYFDVLNTAKINADVAISLIEVLIHTNPCCNGNEICNVLNIVGRINTELCLLVANLVFLTHVDSNKCKCCCQ
ncbi:MAG: hypothetical protein MJA31_12265 [Clostridia bacterium]|nr:hypothetical protein [Clostridia bacterium]